MIIYHKYVYYGAYSLRQMHVFIYTGDFPSAGNMYRRRAALGKIALGKHQIIMVFYGENSKWYQSLQYLNFLYQRTDPRDRVHHLCAASMPCVREAEMR